MIRLTLLLTAAATLFGQQAAFNVPPRDYNLPGQPGAIAMGDFNGDGKLDVVVSQPSYGNYFYVMLGNGNGTFQPPIRSNAGYQTNGAAVGDFNGDGKLDVVLLQQGQNLAIVLLGKGDGTFRAPAYSPIGAPSPFAVAVGDFNGDGKLDIVTADSAVPSAVSLLLGNGDGTFQPAKTFALSSEPNSIVVADFNHDGKMDVAVASYTGGVSVFLGTGTGSFGPAINTINGIAPVAPSSIAAGDLNGDGNVDVVLGDSNGGYLAVMLGKGDGTFQSATLNSPGASTAFITDMNQDGKLDLIGVSPMGALVYLGKGDGTFYAPTGAAIGGTPACVLAGIFRTGSKVPDVVSSAGSDSISILLNKGNGTFYTPASFPVTGLPAWVATADFNHDGRLDLVTSTSNDIAVLLGNGDGTFQPAVTYAAGMVTKSLVVADFDNDGNTDVAVNDVESSMISVFLGKGDGTFQAPVNISLGTRFLPNGLAVGDVNQDGKQDLVVIGGSAGDTVDVLLGNGDGTFQAPLSSTSALALAFVTLADINHDGKLDLLLGGSLFTTPPGAITVAFGNGDGTFQPSVTYSTLDYVAGIAVADLNGDGNPDLIGAGGGSLQLPGGVFVLLGKGDGTFQAAVTYKAGDGAKTPVVADFNGDGKLDVAVSNEFGNDVSILLGNGAGALGRAVNFPANGYAGGVVVGDFNGDHKPDLAIASSASLTLLTNTAK